MHGRSLYFMDHSPSHPCKGGMEHVGFSSTRQNLHQEGVMRLRDGGEGGGGGGGLTSKALTALGFPSAIIVPKKYSFERAFDCALSVFRAATTSSFTAYSTAAVRCGDIGGRW